MRISVSLLICFIFGLVACSRKDELPVPELSLIQIPKGFPELPESILNGLNDERIALGKRLFYDVRLSVDNSISCGSCHRADQAFAENVDLSSGVSGRKGFRNAQALFNLAWKPHFFRDGGVDLLKLAALNPIQNNDEMGSSINAVVAKLQTDAAYASKFKLAYSDTVSATHILHALTCFQASLISGNSRYDQWKNGSVEALSAAELRGKDLFFSERSNCSSCHAGFNFDSPDFKCNGFFESYPDSGRQRITMKISDKGFFAVPSLRNAALTAPYMHNGSVATLEEVVQRYVQGGSGFLNQDPRIKPLDLSAAEVSDLVAFLHSLSDATFINNTHHKP